jgi:hypothetical protein
VVSEYWEYAMGMITCYTWDNDRQKYLAMVLDKYPNEFAWLGMVRREAWP